MVKGKGKGKEGRKSGGKAKGAKGPRKGKGMQ
jgi:hypothetical protein